jgi:immune inhibitor A
MKLKSSVALSLLILFFLSKPCWLMEKADGEQDSSSIPKLCIHPPSPWQIANFYADYKADCQEAGIQSLTFPQYCRLSHKGKSRLEHVRLNPDLVAVPQHKIQGDLNVIVLLVDFEDSKGTQPPKYYERMLFSENILSTGSMHDFYDEVSGGSLRVKGSVHGWLRLPQTYRYYTNKESGMNWNSYPRNAVRMAEDAVQEAINRGVRFDSSLDKLRNGSITALFLIHAGQGAEVLSKAQGRNHIWSHKWGLRRPIAVSDSLSASTYLTVPQDCLVGVCAHELGHLAMGWDDFYDPDYDQNGFWHGAGNWDLMASGSYGEGGVHPVHPMGLHKIQHDWVKSDTIDVAKLQNPTSYTLSAFSLKDSYQVLKLTSPAYAATQFLILECRKRVGFDRSLPGEGLLVWRVDTSRSQNAPDNPALLLIQADGQHQLERAFGDNSGDEGDPFPGTARVRELFDGGEINTSFPGRAPSGILLEDIKMNQDGSVTFNLRYRQPSSSSTQFPATKKRKVEHRSED